MKIGKKMILAAGIAIAFVQLPSRAEDKPTTAPAPGVPAMRPPGTNAAPPPIEIPGLPSQKDKLSYSIGMNIGHSLKTGGYEVDLDILTGAIKDVLAEHELKMTDMQARQIMMDFNREMRAKKEAERAKLAEKNREEGDAFLAENKKKEGVKTHTVTLANGKTAEFQYKIITAGTGPIPKSNDMVSVNYRGTLINGKEFDSSYKRGQPQKFNVNHVVRGWTEALEMMPTGSKWELYLPASLSYEDRPQGPMIEPGSTLIFEIELVSIDSPQPLTSDIIRVPSADELKAGAKVEVLKAEDVAKQIQSNNAAKPKQ